MIITKHGYKRKYQSGGSGIFSKLNDCLSKFISKKQIVDTTLNVTRTAGQKVGQKATTAVNDFVASKLTPKSQMLSKITTTPVKKAAQKTTQETTQEIARNINNLIAWSGQAVKIKDLIGQLKLKTKCKDFLKIMV